MTGNGESTAREPICPPGTLARLQQHHAFAKLADGACTEVPVWLEATFFNAEDRPVPQPRDDLSEAVALARNVSASESAPKEGIPFFLLQMHKRRHPMLITANILAAIWPLCFPRVSRNELLSNSDRQIPGLDTLPTCWLVGLHRWFLANPLLAPAVMEVTIKSGVLWPKLDRAYTLWGDGEVGIPESINLFIYPSLWRSPSRRHRARLLTERPDLAEEFESLAEVLDSGP